MSILKPPFLQACCAPKPTHLGRAVLPAVAPPTAFEPLDCLDCAKIVLHLVEVHNFFGEGINGDGDLSKVGKRFFLLGLLGNGVWERTVRPVQT